MLGRVGVGLGVRGRGLCGWLGEDLWRGLASFGVVGCAWGVDRVCAGGEGDSGGEVLERIGGDARDIG